MPTEYTRGRECFVLNVIVQGREKNACSAFFLQTFLRNALHGDVDNKLAQAEFPDDMDSVEK